MNCRFMPGRSFLMTSSTQLSFACHSAHRTRARACHGPSYATRKALVTEVWDEPRRAFARRHPHRRRGRCANSRHDDRRDRPSRRCSQCRRSPAVGCRECHARGPRSPTCTPTWKTCTGACSVSGRMGKRAAKARRGTPVIAQRRRVGPRAGDGGVHGVINRLRCHPYATTVRGMM